MRSRAGEARRHGAGSRAVRGSAVWRAVQVRGAVYARMWPGCSGSSGRLRYGAAVAAERKVAGGRPPRHALRARGGSRIQVRRFSEMKA